MKEANRPFSHFSARPVQRSGEKLPAVIVLELVPMPGMDTNGWMPGNFVCALTADWQSPQILREMLIRRLRIAGNVPARESAPGDADSLIPILSSEVALKKLLATVHSFEHQAAVPADTPGQDAVAPIDKVGAGLSLRVQAPSPLKAAPLAVATQAANAAPQMNGPQFSNQPGQQRLDRDFALRQNYMQRGIQSITRFPRHHRQPI